MRTKLVPGWSHIILMWCLTELVFAELNFDFPFQSSLQEQMMIYLTDHFSMKPLLKNN